MSHPKNSDFIDQLNAEFNTESDPESESAESVEAHPATASVGVAKKSGEKKLKSSEFARMLLDSVDKDTKKLQVGDKIRGQILVLGKEDVFVATGTRHDGVISRRDILEADGTCAFKTGDTIELYVTQVRGSDIRLSRKATDKNLADDLEDAFDMMLPIQGRIAEVCKGGVRVLVKGKLAFCPISQIDIKHVENPEEYVGKSFEFRITQFSEKGRNIVVSRRKILEEERELSAGSFLEETRDGDVVPGTVVRLEKFGAFVELAPGVDGLVHISEIAWSHIKDPAEVLQVGQKVSVKLLKRESINDRLKVSLSIKQALAAEPEAASGLRPSENPSPVAARGSEAEANLNINDPWNKYSLGQIVTGKVTRKELYGIFVQLEPGITGLLHKSKTIDHPEFHIEKLKVNDSVAVQVGEIIKSERRISLDVPRDPNEDDWKTHKQAATSFGTLGDQFKAALAKKK